MAVRSIAFGTGGGCGGVHDDGVAARALHTAATEFRSGQVQLRWLGPVKHERVGRTSGAARPGTGIAAFSPRLAIAAGTNVVRGVTQSATCPRSAEPSTSAFSTFSTSSAAHGDKLDAIEHHSAVPRHEPDRCSATLAR